MCSERSSSKTDDNCEWTCVRLAAIVDAHETTPWAFGPHIVTVSEPLFFRSGIVLMSAGIAQLAERFLRKE